MSMCPVSSCQGCGHGPPMSCDSWIRRVSHGAQPFRHPTVTPGSRRLIAFPLSWTATASRCGRRSCIWQAEVESRVSSGTGHEKHHAGCGRHGRPRCLVMGCSANSCRSTSITPTGVCGSHPSVLSESDSYRPARSGLAGVAAACKAYLSCLQVQCDMSWHFTPGMRCQLCPVQVARQGPAASPPSSAGTRPAFVPPNVERTRNSRSAEQVRGRGR